MPVSADSRYRLLDLFIQMEAALKQKPRYQDVRGGGQAAANWSRFARDIGPELSQRINPETKQVLLTRPPMREVIANGLAQYDPNTPPLPGGHRWETAGARLIVASVRVRNNLFHGGKEDPARERYRGHDQAVVDAAIEVLGHANRLLQRVK